MFPGDFLSRFRSSAFQGGQASSLLALLVVIAVHRVSSHPLAATPQAYAHHQSTLSHQHFISAHNSPRAPGLAVAALSHATELNASGFIGQGQVRCPRPETLSLVGAPRLSRIRLQYRQISATLGSLGLSRLRRGTVTKPGLLGCRCVAHS